MIRVNDISLEGLMWEDEHTWAPFAATENRGGDGSFIMQVGALKKGRPFTLGGDGCWLSRETLSQLNALAGSVVTLHIGQRSWQCRFRLYDMPHLEAEPVLPDTSRYDDSTEKFALTKLKLVEI
ncbi:MAG: hypothetical protein ACRCYC_05385 [Paraclostridium sp.]|uniref:hypothetical protein n=1 Tax=Paraclostridium sp. TaxID=2023273 RepID=UPI003F2EB3D9